MPSWLIFLLSAALAGLLYWLGTRRAYRRGYEAGQCDMRWALRPDPLARGIQSMFDRLLGMAEGFKIGYEKAKSEKVQNMQKKTAF